ncbi:hypothetical protein [Clostridium butyricum]|uniref:hypothetical protein n=1 Tax=Clostridium butyricum TaxID=1492 RepID=UPI0012B78A11|nr:hypothetical protein [Clostridium butyricum]
MAVTKPVSFKNKEQDLVNFVQGKDFSYYVKELIRRDMNNANINAMNRDINIIEHKKRNKRITDYDI